MENLLDLLQTAIATKKPADKVKFHEELYNVTFKSMLVFISAWYNEDALDILQSLYIKAFMLPLNRFLEPTKTVKGINAYMIEAAKNHMRDNWRRKKQHEKSVQDYIQLQAHNTRSPLNDGQIDKEFLLRHLSKMEAQVITLQFNQDLEDCEIRDILNLSSNDSVRQHRSRALKKLRKIHGTSI